MDSDSGSRTVLGRHSPRVEWPTFLVWGFKMFLKEQGLGSRVLGFRV